MKKRKLRLHRLGPHAGRIAKFLLKSQVLTIFLALCGLGFCVGMQTRPDPHAHAELFDHLSVASFRDAPGDTSSRFVVELAACGKTFSRYDVDAQTFLPPERGRAYSRMITGASYPPLRVRGHIREGFWVDVPDAPGRSLLPEQFSELYRSTLDYVKPVTMLTGALGILSGYSVGYRLGTWNSSLCSHGVQERVLATPGLGRKLTLEAWRRVLLEPVVMADEDGAARFAAVRGTHQLYTNFFRIALNDSDGFIPREAERLAGLGRTYEARAMLSFVTAVRRAAADSAHLNSGDFGAIERWASLLDRRGHWAHGAIPPPGEERARYLGTLAWYGLAPSPPEVDRVWVGSRMLVREGNAEGFVADEILATGVGCPSAWRERLHDERTSTNALASAWFADRPEFVALAALGGRAAQGVARTARNVVVRPPSARTAPPNDADATMTSAVTAAVKSPVTVVGRIDSVSRRSVHYPFRSMGTNGAIIIVTADSTRMSTHAQAGHATFARVDSLMSNWTTTSEVARLNREAAKGPTTVHPEVTVVVAEALRTWRDSEGAFDITVEPLMRAWGFLGGPRRVPPQQEADAAFKLVGAGKLLFDSSARTLQFKQDGMKIDLGGIAKGYAVDAAADSLRARGVTDALVDISGNMLALGAPANADHWRIGIRDPRDRVPYFARLQLAANQGISTSGKYEQFVAADNKTYGHIMDPRSGRPADGLISVTVVAPSAMTADAWSTALFVLGVADAKRKAKERADLAAVLVEPGADGIDTVWVEADLKDRFALEGEGRTLFRIEYF